MIYQIIKKVIGEEKNKLFKYGEQKRDFVYVKDIVQANIKAALYGKSGVYNVGTGNTKSFNEIIDVIKNRLGDFNVEYIDNPYSFYQNYTEANIELTRNVLFYEPKYGLSEGIGEYIEKLVN